MGSRTTGLLVRRLDAAAKWAAHIGGGMAFLSAFAALYVMCGAIAAGFDVRQALLMDVAAFVCGLGLLASARLWRGARARFHTRAPVSCNFARKVSAPDKQMARTPEHPGHLGADVSLPVPA